MPRRFSNARHTFSKLLGRGYDIRRNTLPAGIGLALNLLSPKHNQPIVLLIGRIATRLGPRKELKRRPFLGLHLGFAVPPAFLPIGTRVPTCALALGSRGCAVADGWGALVLSIGRPARLSSLSQSNSGPIFTRLRALPPNTLTSSYFRHSNKHAQTKPNSLAQVQRYSLRLVFLPHIRFTAKSRAPVGSPCQSRLCSSARRIHQNRAVLASAP
jgi:hypothetical protein